MKLYFGPSCLPNLWKFKQRSGWGVIHVEDRIHTFHVSFQSPGIDTKKYLTFQFLSVSPYTHVLPWSSVSWQFGELRFPKMVARHHEESKSWIFIKSNKHKTFRVKLTNTWSRGQCIESWINVLSVIWKKYKSYFTYNSKKIHGPYLILDYLIF